MLVPKECLLELGAGVKQGVEEERFGEEDLCDSLEERAREASVGGLLQT